MYKTKLCMGTHSQFKISIEEQIKLIKKTGFEAFFTGWDENLKEYRRLADELGMIYQSIHAPFLNAAKMWRDDDEAKIAVDELLRCVRDCADVNVPILIVHPFIGVWEKPNPNESGIANFRIVVNEAKANNVKIAFENVEADEYLGVLMNAFSEDDNVGFCWDSGHEQCYNRGKDMLELYGDKLIATHLNDNLGISDYEGNLTWTDDLHLLPFDGIIDWRKVADRLNKCRYDGILTFELNRGSMPDRHDGDKYVKMPLEEYFAECYARACRIASLRRGV